MAPPDRLRAALARGRPLLADGGTGTALRARGIAGDALDAVTSAPGALREVHREFVAAGARVLHTASFTAPRRLADAAGAANAGHVSDLVRDAARLAREAAETAGAGDAPGVFVLGSLGPVGHGDPQAAAAVVGPLAAALAGRVDGIALETMISIAEAGSMLAAVRDVFPGPVVVTFAIDADDRSYGGDALAEVLAWIGRVRPDAAGFNCGEGPDPVRRAGKRLAASLPDVPRVLRPPASAPGRGDSSAADFARFARDAAPGAAIVGGCCGAAAAHITAMAAAMAAMRSALAGT